MISRWVVLIAAGLAAAAGAFPTVPEKPEHAVTDAELSKLYEDGRYFELRDALSATRADPSVEMEFYLGAVDQIFNRLDLAVWRLGKYLRAVTVNPDHRRRRDALFFLADAFYRLGRYREAAAVCREILNAYGSVFDEEERASCENQAELWAALADVPLQSVDIRGDTTIRMTNRMIPVRIGGRTFLFEYDTGSTISILGKAAADRLGIPVRGRPVTIQTGTGERIEGRVGVVPEMTLGAIVIRNAVFLILPESAFSWADLPPGEIRGGLLGMPVLAAFREFSETRDGELIIPARPPRRFEGNMGFSGFRPFVEILYRGERLKFCLDTGANATVLYPPFYRLYRGFILNRTPVRKTKVEAVGGSRVVPICVLDEFSFNTGGKDLIMRKVVVETRVTHVASKYFHGNLGLDILSHSDRMTFNFESMSFILE